MLFSNKNICAIVVTHNRLQLLQECISALQNQSYKCDIFVVNNNSQDDTEFFLKSNSIHHFTSNNNVGGAGGFNLGIKHCLDYDYLWLMDDDCIPTEDALKKLVESAVLLNDKFGFLSSKSLWIDGSLNKMNIAKYDNKNFVFNNIFKVYQATFVSFFIKLDTVKKVGLPIKDFFIWGDDIEYSRRIAVINKIDSYYIYDSVVIHKTKNNYGSKIAFDSFENLNRYFYAYRNELFLYKNEGLTGIIYYTCKCFYNLIRILLFSKDHKKERIRILLTGVKEGFSFNPCIEFL